MDKVGTESETRAQPVTTVLTLNYLPQSDSTLFANFEGAEVVKVAGTFKMWTNFFVDWGSGEHSFLISLGEHKIIYQFPVTHDIDGDVN